MYLVRGELNFTFPCADCLYARDILENKQQDEWKHIDPFAEPFKTKFSCRFSELRLLFYTRLVVCACLKNRDLLTSWIRPILHMIPVRVAGTPDYCRVP
jgi:hypothetical protein